MDVSFAQNGAFNRQTIRLLTLTSPSLRWVGHPSKYKLLSPFLNISDPLGTYNLSIQSAIVASWGRLNIRYFNCLLEEKKAKQTKNQE